jgi:arylsulfatase A-like enzyme
VTAGRLGRALTLVSCLQAIDASAGDRPNIVLILADDLGYADVAFNGAKDIPTPHIDRLAAGGVRFSQAYVSHPFCSPSRAGLLTGRYQQRFGHENNPKYDPRDERSGLPPGEVTLADVLRRAGYRTGAVGKWHLGAVPRFHPNARGFVEFFGFIGGSHNYLPGLPGSGQYVIPLDRNGAAVDEREYLTEAFAREAVAFIERHRGDPFFLYLPFNAPHGPFQAPPKTYLDRFAGVADEHRRIYYAMVSALDDAVGRVLAALRHTGREDDTIVFFLSDNGGRREAVVSSNGPLRGYKEQLFEGGIRVPFVMRWPRWPATLAAGRLYDRPVIALDVFATAASAARARPAADRKTDGVDLLPYLLGRKKGPPHERLFWRTGGGTTYAVRQGDYKLVKETGQGVMLFDLARDPGETHDLAAKRPAIVRQLDQAYRAWNAELIPPSFPDARADR